MEARGYAEIIEMPSFQRAAKKLFSDEEIGALVLLVALEPHMGKVIPRTGGFRKMRVPRIGRGKRGGARVIYYYVGRREQVYLVDAYAKNQRENLTREQENELWKLARVIEQEVQS